MKLRFKLQSKILSLLLGALFLVQGCIIGYISWSTRNNAIESYKRTAREAAEKSAAKIESRFLEVVRGANIMTNVMSTLD